MSKTTKTTNDSSSATYTIDIRVFLTFIVTGMVVAFGAGVALGPSVGSEMTDRILQTVVGGGGGGPNIVDRKEATENSRMTRSTSTSTSTSTTTSTLNEKHVNFEQPSLEDLGDGIVRHHVNSQTEKDNKSDEEEEEHLPAGQHLLVDIKNVEAAFLNSEERLAGAMVEVVQSAGLTLLSYHCHSLLPAGVSCVGVLLESHISFHTWPDEGVITLDLFTCGSNPLLPVVPELERLFGIARTKPNSTELEKVVTLWSHELRGFRDSAERKKHHLDSQSDLATWIVSALEVLQKDQIVSTVSPYQRIDIWDVLDIDDTPSYNDAIKHNLQEGDPRWLTSEIVTPERHLFLDGTLQTMSETEKEFHEALVHPAMFTHPNPQHVAIIGAGDGGVLREVLKHKTIQSATMVEIDEMLVNLCREHLPFASDCKDLVGIADVCFDDQKANVIYDDGRTWFVQHYGPDAQQTPLVKQFDVIIVDALDPEVEKNPISGRLYNDANFIDSLFHSLSHDGVIAFKVGTAPNIHDPRADMGSFRNRETLFQLLEHHKDAAAMMVYEEGHSGYPEPKSFLVVCKSAHCRNHWYASADVIDYEIYDRIVDTHSANSPLTHFDGATHHSYQVPPKAWETVYCRRDPTPFECDYIQLDQSKPIFEFDHDPSTSDFRIHSENDTTSIYATKDIPKGSYIMPDEMASSFTIHDESKANLIQNTQISGTGKMSVIENFLDYVDTYGHQSFSTELGLTYIEVGSSHLIRRSTDDSEINIGRWMPQHPTGKVPIYSPVYDRHIMSFDLFMVATKDIQAGDEIVRHEHMWNQA